MVYRAKRRFGLASRVAPHKIAIWPALFVVIPCHQVFPGLMLDSAFQHGRRLPNHAVFIRKDITGRPVPNKAVMSFLGGGRGARDIGLSHVAALVRHPYVLWRIAHQKLPLGMRSHQGDLFFMTGQLPNPHSQVSLSDRQRDRHGLPIARASP